MHFSHFSPDNILFNRVQKQSKYYLDTISDANGFQLFLEKHDIKINCNKDHEFVLPPILRKCMNKMDVYNCLQNTLKNNNFPHFFPYTIITENEINEREKKIVEYYDFNDDDDINNYGTKENDKNDKILQDEKIQSDIDHGNDNNEKESEIENERENANSNSMKNSNNENENENEIACSSPISDSSRRSSRRSSIKSIASADSRDRDRDIEIMEDNMSDNIRDNMSNNQNKRDIDNENSVNDDSDCSDWEICIGEDLSKCNYQDNFFDEGDETYDILNNKDYIAKDNKCIYCNNDRKNKEINFYSPSEIIFGFTSTVSMIPNGLMICKNCYDLPNFVTQYMIDRHFIISDISGIIKSYIKPFYNLIESNSEKYECTTYLTEWLCICLLCLTNDEDKIIFWVNCNPVSKYYGRIITYVYYRILYLHNYFAAPFLLTR